MVCKGIMGKTCNEVFTIDEIRPAPGERDVLDLDFKGSLTCPNCNARHEYTRNDIRLYEGDVEGWQPHGNKTPAKDSMAEPRLRCNVLRTSRMRDLISSAARHRCEE